MPPVRLLIVDDSANIHEDIRKILAAPQRSAIEDLEDELFGSGVSSVKTSSPTEQLNDDPTEVRFEIESAYQGDDGIALLSASLAQNRPFAVAFVDMRMPPGLDGLATVEKLWQIDPRLQVVICSAYSDYSWAEMTRRIGRSDRFLILRKPFENVEVLQLAHCLSAKWRLAEANVRVERA